MGNLNQLKLLVHHSLRKVLVDLLLRLASTKWLQLINKYRAGAPKRLREGLAGGVGECGSGREERVEVGGDRCD